MKQYIFLPILLIIFSTGCNTTRTARGTITPATNPALNSAVAQHDEQISKLTFQFNQINENNKTLIDHINRLNKEITLLQRKIASLEKNNQIISDELKAEKAERINDIDKLLKEVAKQTAAAMNAQKNTSSSSSSSSNTGKGPIGKGEFYEYTVEAGATLGAIAKAYKVSVSDIRKANNLKSDMIQIGQKLYIPKK